MRQPEIAACDPFEITYTIAEDSSSITFQPCGVTTRHPMDVRQKYCPVCHRFMDLIALAKEVAGDAPVR